MLAARVCARGRKRAHVVVDRVSDHRERLPNEEVVDHLLHPADPRPVRRELRGHGHMDADIYTDTGTDTWRISVYPQVVKARKRVRGK